MDLDEIRDLIRKGQYEVSFHAQQERLGENLDISEIEVAIIGHLPRWIDPRTRGDRT